MERPSYSKSKNVSCGRTIRPYTVIHTSYSHTIQIPLSSGYQRCSHKTFKTIYVTHTAICQELIFLSHKRAPIRIGQPRKLNMSKINSLSLEMFPLSLCRFAEYFLCRSLPFTAFLIFHLSVNISQRVFVFRVPNSFIIPFRRKGHL